MTNKQADKTQGSSTDDPLAALGLAGKTPDLVYRFQKTELNANMNRWYTYLAYKPSDASAQYRVIGRFGRVGDRGNIKDFGMLYHDQLEKLVSDRVYKKGYQRVDLAQISQNGSAPAGVDTSTPEGRLVALIFSEAGERIAQYLATTVDALSQEQIRLGRSLLDQIRSALQKQLTPDPARLRLVQEYYNTIPTKLPRRIDPLELARGFDVAEQEVVLQQLEAAIATHKVTKAGGTQQQALGAAISALDKFSQQYRSLHQYVESTAVHGYRIRVEDVYSIEVPDERRRYTTNQRGKGNRKLLFHGTRNSNIRHILRSGLVIMKTVSTGRMFGDGIYYANKASKSTNYCSSTSSSAPQMLLVSEVALGRVYEARDSQHYKAPPAGYDSVMGVGGKTALGFSKLQNDEFVIYDPSQATLRYLVTFRR